jgi:3-methylcrotonyl-CoA carboxylase alpha subunit
MGNMFRENAVIDGIKLKDLMMQLKYRNTQYDVLLEPDGEDYVLTVNGEKQKLNAKKSDSNLFTVTNDNVKTNVYVAEDVNRFYVNIEGTGFTFDKCKEEESSFGEEEKMSADKDIVKPPMPGSIVKVLVTKDQKVSDGDALIIIEAMKMETTLYSSISGIVTEVNVSAGEQVDSDKILLIVEKEKE